mgnify:CR=1 FL=1
MANFISDVVSGRIPPEVIEYIVDNYENFDTEDEKYKEFISSINVGNYIIKNGKEGVAHRFDPIGYDVDRFFRCA